MDKSIGVLVYNWSYLEWLDNTDRKEQKLVAM